MQAENLAHYRAEMDRAAEIYRAYVVTVLINGASFNEVAKATGLSTNTLQRWKREASQ